MSDSKPPKLDIQSLIVVPPLPLKVGQDPNEGKVFALPYDVYTDPKYELKAPANGIVREMLKYGTTLGYLPSGVGIGVGSMCYLVNLRSIKT